MNVLLQPENEYSIDFNKTETGGMLLDTDYQCIRFQPFQQATWHVICDASLKELPPFNCRVDADKGFNYSNTDDCFVCQKKNHFQVTVQVQPTGDLQFVKTPDGLRKIDNFCVHFYGVKAELPSQTIKIEQSQSDRSKQVFRPAILDLISDHVTKITIGRLHFSETTTNNMRKKGKPNPDQRFFNLVVSICAHVGDQAYPVVAYSSDKIIVRGRVGINTDKPDDPLVVHGNIKITGHIIQPSDIRVKINTTELDSRKQLKNVSNMRIMKFCYTPEFAQQAGLSSNELSDTGVIAQEISSVLPDAVKETGDIILPNGEKIENFLVVNKERIFMENVGAVKELCRVTNNLEARIGELERINCKLKILDSLKSTSSGRTVISQTSIASGLQKTCHHHNFRKRDDQASCMNSFLQGTIITLVLIMTFCLVAMATLYILEWQKKHNSEEKTMMNVSVYKHGIPQHNYSQEAETFLSSMLLPQSNDGLQRYSESNLLDSSAPQNTLSNIQRSTSSQTGESNQTNRLPVGLPSSCVKNSFIPANCPLVCCDVEAWLEKKSYDFTFLKSNKTTDVEHEPHAMNFSNISVSSGRNDHMTMPSRRKMNASFRHSDLTYQGKVTIDIPNIANEPNYNLLISLGNSSAKSGVRPLQQTSNHTYSPHELSTGPIKLITEQRLTKERNYKIHPIFFYHPYHHFQQENTTETMRMNSKQLGHKQESSKLTGVVESLRLKELNTTIGVDYCVHQCTSGPWYTYDIPVSRYMALDYVTLQFNLTQAFFMEMCTTDTPLVHCSSVKSDHIYSQNKEKLTFLDSNPSWTLPLGVYFRSTYRFRILTSGVDTRPCLLQSSDAGFLFLEYKLRFQRDCGK
ncbi:myelin regulatory factor-like [Limulus polyphemus]|uniref:Myelin regulatory factor-like n=1 Tax=Limulus polyphemus TaxID=6850 RepID=A0ABM1SJT1_LIMPO|nr:myelin regulatory factor-like [Limulus polyphemus]